VAPKNPKSKGTHSDLQFFKIDPDGKLIPAGEKSGITSAQRTGKSGTQRPPLEEKSEGTKPPDQTGSRFLRSEPVFTLDEDMSRLIPIEKDTSRSQSKVESENLDESQSTSLPEFPQQSPLGEEIELLKPQIENISRLPDAQDLTSDQTDVLRKYISLKEAEVRDLRDQHRQYQTFLKKVSGQVEQLSRRNREMVTDLEAVKRREDGYRSELREQKARHEEEVQLLKSDYEEKLRKSGNYEAQVDNFMQKREEWREKVREDLKRIKLKERELENKYELLKRDTQALLDSKDKHVLELKKKNDALELELEALEERLRRANTILSGIDAKKRRLLETLKLTTSLLEEIDTLERDDKERKTG
jgi:hypothetical protein